MRIIMGLRVEEESKIIGALVIQIVRPRGYFYVLALR